MLRKKKKSFEKGRIQVTGHRAKNNTHAGLCRRFEASIDHAKRIGFRVEKVEEERERERMDRRERDWMKKCPEKEEKRDLHTVDIGGT